MPETVFPLFPHGRVSRALAAVRSGLAKRTWRSHGVAGMPKSLHVKVASSKAVIRLVALFTFQRSKDGCGAALFDLASWPYRAYLGHVLRGTGPQVKGSILRFPLVPAGEEQNCSCKLEFDWPVEDSSSGTLRSLGQLMPEIVLSPGQAAAESLVLPEQEVTLLPDISNSIRVRIAIQGGSRAIEDPREVFTWVFMHPPRVTSVRQTSGGEPPPVLRVEDKIREVISGAHFDSVLDVIARTASVTSNLLGTTVPSPLPVFFKTSDVDPETPGVLLFTENQLHDPDVYTLSYEAARQVASVTWGAACRAHSSNARELEEAIAAAVAVRAADAVTGEDRSRTMLTRLQVRAIRAAPLQLWQRLLSVKQHRVAFQLAAQILGVALEGGDAVFAQLTARGWRRSTRSDVLLRIAEQVNNSQWIRP